MSKPTIENSKKSEKSDFSNLSLEELQNKLEEIKNKKFKKDKEKQNAIKEIIDLVIEKIKTEVVSNLNSLADIKTFLNDQKNLLEDIKHYLDPKNKKLENIAKTQLRKSFETFNNLLSEIEELRKDTEIEVKKQGSIFKNIKDLFNKVGGFFSGSNKEITGPEEVDEEKNKTNEDAKKNTEIVLDEVDTEKEREKVLIEKITSAENLLLDFLVEIQALNEQENSINKKNSIADLEKEFESKKKEYTGLDKRQTNDGVIKKQIDVISEVIKKIGNFIKLLKGKQRLEVSQVNAVIKKLNKNNKVEEVVISSEETTTNEVANNNTNGEESNVVISDEGKVFDAENILEKPVGENVEEETISLEKNESQTTPDIAGAEANSEVQTGEEFKEEIKNEPEKNSWEESFSQEVASAQSFDELCEIVQNTPYELKNPSGKAIKKIDLEFAIKAFATGSKVALGFINEQYGIRNKVEELYEQTVTQNSLENTEKNNNESKVPDIEIIISELDNESLKKVIEEISLDDLVLVLKLLPDDLQTKILGNAGQGELLEEKLNETHTVRLGKVKEANDLFLKKALEIISLEENESQTTPDITDAEANSKVQTGEDVKEEIKEDLNEDSADTPTETNESKKEINEFLNLINTAQDFESLLNTIKIWLIYSKSKISFNVLNNVSGNNLSGMELSLLIDKIKNGETVEEDDNCGILKKAKEMYQEKHKITDNPNPSKDGEQLETKTTDQATEDNKKKIEEVFLNSFKIKSLDELFADQKDFERFNSLNEKERGAILETFAKEIRHTAKAEGLQKWQEEKNEKLKSAGFFKKIFKNIGYSFVEEKKRFELEKDFIKNLDPKYIGENISILVNTLDVLKNESNDETKNILAKEYINFLNQTTVSAFDKQALNTINSLMSDSEKSIFKAVNDRIIKTFSNKGVSYTAGALVAAGIGASAMPLFLLTAGIAGGVTSAINLAKKRREESFSRRGKKDEYKEGTSLADVINNSIMISYNKINELFTDKNQVDLVETILHSNLIVWSEKNALKEKNALIQKIVEYKFNNLKSETEEIKDKKPENNNIRFKKAVVWLNRIGLKGDAKLATGVVVGATAGVFIGGVSRFLASETNFSDQPVKKANDHNIDLEETTNNNSSPVNEVKISQAEIDAVNGVKDQIRQFGGGEDFNYEYANGKVNITRAGHPGTYELNDKGLIYIDADGSKQILKEGKDFNTGWEKFEKSEITKKSPSTAPKKVEKLKITTEEGGSSEKLNKESIIKDNQTETTTKKPEEVYVFDDKVPEDVVEEINSNNHNELAIESEVVVPKVEDANELKPTPINTEVLENKPLETVNLEQSNETSEVLTEDLNDQANTSKVEETTVSENEDVSSENNTDETAEPINETIVTNEEQALDYVFGKDATIKISGTEDNLKCEFNYTGLDYGDKDQDLLSKEILLYKKLQEVGLEQSNTAQAVKQSIVNEVNLYNPLPNTDVEEMLKPENNYNSVLEKINEAVSVNKNFDESLLITTDSEELVKIDETAKQIFSDKYFIKASTNKLEVKYLNDFSKLPTIDHKLEFNSDYLTTTPSQKDYLVRELVLYKTLQENGQTNNNIYKVLETSLAFDVDKYKISIGETTINDDPFTELETGESAYWTAFKNAKLEDIIKLKQ